MRNVPKVRTTKDLNWPIDNIDCRSAQKHSDYVHVPRAW